MSKCSPSSKTLAKSGLEPDSYTEPHRYQSQPLYRLSQILIGVLLLTLRLYNFEFVFTVVKSSMPSYQKPQCRQTAIYILVACDGGLQRKKINTDDHLSMCSCSGGTELDKVVRVPGREFRFFAPIAGQHLFLNLNQLILWRRICLLSFRQSCECCQTNGFARPVLRDRVSLATKVTCATAHSKVCSFCPHFRLFCSIIINFSKKIFCSPMIEVRILNRR